MAAIAISGGIGTGKSTLIHSLKKRGYTVVLTDQLAQECLNQPEIIAKVTSKYPQLLGLDQKKLRSSLAEIVFTDTKELDFIEKLIHPCVQQKITEIKRDFQGEFLFVEVPVLRAVTNYDFVVIVDSPQDVRIARLIDRGLDIADIQNRIANQPQENDFLAIADLIFDGTISNSKYEESVSNLISKIESSINV